MLTACFGNLRKKNNLAFEAILSTSELFKNSNRLCQYSSELENYAYSKYPNEEKDYTELVDKLMENLGIITKSAMLSEKVTSVL